MSFEKALSFVLNAEGGYNNDPADSGGATNKGITQAVYNGYRGKGAVFVSVRNITDEEVRSIYHDNYWNTCHCEKMSDELAIAVFDTAVNAGCQRAIKILQACLDVNTDGVFGEDTLAAIGGIADSKDFVSKYLSGRSAFYQRLVQINPGKSKFLQGWLNRVENLREFIYT